VNPPRRSRPPAAAALLLWAWVVLAAPRPALARAVTVSCKTTVSTYSWYPLPLKTIARIVEGRVLQRVTRSGKLSLLAGGGGAADLQLKITARIIEDAQQFSVFATAVPLRQNRAGSMAAVATRPINQRNNKIIQQMMEQAADEAARKLERLLTPYLPLLAAADEPRKVVPVGKLSSVDWGKALRLAAGRRGGGNPQQLAIRARKEGSARMSLAHCASGGGQRGDQLRCIDALAQLARRHPSAQRALIAVLFSPVPPRNQVQEWKRARLRAFKISTSFAGPARDEAVQAWLHLLASDHSDQYHVFGGRREDYLIMETVSRYLARKPSTPNLDLALARCSLPAKKKSQPPDSYCLKVMKAVPVARRLALLWRQLSAKPVYSHYEPWRAWVAMLKAVSDRNKPLHPAVEDLCVSRIQRSFWRPDRAECLELLGRQGKPTPKLLRFLVQVLASADKGIMLRAEGALDDLVKRAPKLCPALERHLGPRVRRGTLPKHYPGNQLPRALKRCRSGR
jgi:hypothetical protein